MRLWRLLNLTRTPPKRNSLKAPSYDPFINRLSKEMKRARGDRIDPDELMNTGSSALQIHGGHLTQNSPALTWAPWTLTENPVRPSEDAPILVPWEEGSEGVKKTGWDWWRDVLGSPKTICAPMVDASDLPFRLLTKAHGTDLTVTPMFHSHNFSTQPLYRARSFSTTPSERPVWAQFCANDPDTLLEAAKYIEGVVDGIDLNLGCPQGIARRGHYGAFLMEEPDLIHSLVSKLAAELRIPVTAKIRVFPLPGAEPVEEHGSNTGRVDIERTVAYAKMLQDAGASVVSVHGRTRDQKRSRIIRADLEVIAAIKKALDVPVVANGNLQVFSDVEEVLAISGADAVMSAESLLWNPFLFDKALARPKPPLNTRCPEGQYSIDCAREYVELARKYPVPLKVLRGHIFKFFIETFKAYAPDSRAVLGQANNIEDVAAVVETVAKSRAESIAAYRVADWEVDADAVAAREKGLAQGIPPLVLETPEEKKERKKAAAAAAATADGSSSINGGVDSGGDPSSKPADPVDNPSPESKRQRT